MSSDDDPPSRDRQQANHGGSTGRHRNAPAGDGPDANERADPSGKGGSGSGRALVIGMAALLVVALSLWLLPLPLAGAGSVLGLLMLAIAAIDADHFIVPDILSLPAIALGLLASGRLVLATSPDLVALDNVLGAAVGAFSLWAVAVGYEKARGHAGLGFGDVKLAAAGGAWVGLSQFPQMLFLASASALVLVTLAAWRGGANIDRRTRVPFGAFLAPAIWIVWLLDRLGLLL